MKLLFAHLKERNLKWPRIIAKTAEEFTVMNARQSSGFRLALADDISEELAERCALYITHAANANDITAFRKFFENEENSLRGLVQSRFGIEVPGKDSCQIVREKYEAILSSRPQNKHKEPIGFQ